MRLSSRDWRAMRLGALAVAAIAVYVGAVRPLLRAAVALEQRKEALVELRIRSAGPGLSRIGASLEGESDLAGLLLLLHSLETAGTLFHVSGLRVEAPGGGLGEVEVLRFGFTLRAFVLATIEDERPSTINRDNRTTGEEGDAAAQRSTSRIAGGWGG